MLSDITKIIREAGDIILSYYQANNSNPIHVSNKEKTMHIGSVVTKADLDSESLIISHLKKKFPSHGIYGEESGLVNEDKEYMWYVDPLDGTSNFIHNIPLFGISIGLVKNNEPVLGVLYFPALDELFYAEKGKGAFCNDKQIHVSKKNIDEALYYGGGTYQGRMYMNSDIANNVAFTKIIDSSSYELAHIAKGDAEIYELTSVNHDVVAGSILIREAGGKVTDWFGRPWTTKSKTILATNGVVHDSIVDIFKGEFYEKSSDF